MDIKYPCPKGMFTRMSCLYGHARHNKGQVVILMIRSFKNKETESVFLRIHSTRLPYNIQRRAYAKLLQVHFATQLVEIVDYH